MKLKSGLISSVKRLWSNRKAVSIPREVKSAVAWTTPVLRLYGHMIITDNRQSAYGLEEMVFENFGSKVVAISNFETNKKINHHIYK